MADTLRALAGPTFMSADAIARLHAPLPASEVVLDRYVFLPHARTGIAAALSTPFAWSRPTEATIAMKVPVIDERGSLDAEMDVRVHGPADVTEIDPRQVVRTHPKADAGHAEADDLVHVEFDRPDLPWLFTPTGPDEGRLVPWITLVVAERRHVRWGERRGATRRARIRRDQLQPLHDAWAWAHAQVMGARPATPATSPTLEQRLSERNAAQNLSRLVCPRRLEARTAYVACVVPTFLAGAQAGLGLTPTATLEPAWGTAADFAAGDTSAMVELPVYYAWSFGTGEEGNFESLARKLRPAVAPPGVGRRRVDATRPWGETGPALAATAPGAEMVVNGPVVSPQQPQDPPQVPEDPPEQPWPPEASQHWPQAFSDELVARLNRPDAQAHLPKPEPPLVGPPLYGSNHARQPRIETATVASADQPQWFRQLNLDPRNRIVAGLGTRVVQAEQEDLMAAAWNQLGDLEAANRALRFAQLAKHVGASLHRRHLARLTDAAVVSMTERVHAKIRDAPQRSVWASLASSSLPTSVTVGAFRRLARVRGPVVKVAVRAADQRVRSVEALTVRSDRLTRDWVRHYAAPDGVSGIGDAARERLTDDLAAQIAPGLDRATLLARWDEQLAKPALPDRLNPAELAGAQLPDEVNLSRELVAAALGRLVRIVPTPREMAADRELAITGAVHGTLMHGLISAAPEAGVETIEVSREDVERLRLAPVGESEDGTRMVVELEALRAFATQALETLRSHRVRVSLEDHERTAMQLSDLAWANVSLAGPRLLAGLEAIAGKVVLDDPYADAARTRVSVPALKLVQKLDPAITVAARIKGRLTSGSGRLPGWLPPGWLDRMRVEPVMAHPRFAHPMYEPLHRYDREWMVPGLGRIKQPDMVTLLETNNRFIEGYLVGLNHEMGRELLWREYPADQRGTYFASFWTGAPELTADLHEPAWRSGELGSHVRGELDGQLVLLVRGDLVRRYPGVVASAVPQSGTEHGIPTFAAGSAVATLFHVHLPPNVLLVGFATTKERIKTSGGTWWFTLSENPTEPRFGLDPAREDEQLSRDSLVWDDFGIGPGGFLDATRHTDLAFEGSGWGASSAQVAFLLFQLPARAAFLAAKMLAKASR